MASSENRARVKEKGCVYLWRECSKDVPVSLLPGVCLQGVAVSDSHRLVVSEHGQVYEGPTTSQLQLCRPLAGHHVVQVSCGAHHMAVVTLEGCVFCWGDSTQGQCGVVGRVSQPQQVYITHTPETALPCDGVANTPVRAMQVGCGDHHTMALSDKGELWTWGTGDALGLGNPGIVLRPCLVNYLVGRRVISVVCGAQHTLALVAKAQRLGAQKGGYHIEQHSQAPATCARCKGDIYTYTESGDECVISDHHTCPLGLELYPRAVVPCDSGVTECNPDNMDDSQPEDSTVMSLSPRATPVSRDTGETRTSEGLCRVHRVTHPPDKAAPSCDITGTDREEDELPGSCQDELTRTDDQRTESDVSKSSTPVASTLESADPKVDSQLTRCSRVTEQGVQEPVGNAVAIGQDSKIEPAMSSVGTEQIDSGPLTRSSEQVMDSETGSVVQERTCDSNEAAGSTGSEQVLKIEPSLSSAGIEPSLNSTGIEPSLSSTGIEPSLSSAGIEPSETDPGPLMRTSEQVMDSDTVTISALQECVSSEAAGSTVSELDSEHKSEPEMSCSGVTNSSEPTKNSTDAKCKPTGNSTGNSATQNEHNDSNTIPKTKADSNCDSSSTVLDLESASSTPVVSVLTRSESQQDHPNQITKSRSSFLDETEAKEYLEKQLYGDSDDVFLSSIGSMSAESDTPGNAGPFVKKLQQNLLSYMPSSNVQEAVTSWTKNVVSNIRTSIDRFSFTSTEGIGDADNQGVDDVEEDGYPSELQYVTDGTSSLPRSASWCVESKSTLKSTISRKASLPVFVTQVKNAGGVLEATSITETEVWSFGQGSKGQLGHGDKLDRLHPTCVRELTDKHVVQLATSSHHCLALTIDSQVYSWGCNDDCQLGYQDAAAASPSPRLVKIAGDPAIWDIAAGGRHSLFLTDGCHLSTDVYYTGTLRSHSDGCKALKKTSLPTQMVSLNKVGRIVRLAAGGALCACMAEPCSEEFASTLHELAATERHFHSQMTIMSSVILKPFLSPELVQRLEKTSYGTPFELLVDAFSQISNAVAVNHLEASEVLRSGLDLGRLSCISQPDTLVTMYQNYSKCFCDVLALGGFLYCVNTSRKFFDGISSNFVQILGSDQVVAGDVPATFQKALQLPLDRMKQYATLIEKVAHLFPAFGHEQHQLAEITDKWHNLILTTIADQKLAGTTKAFWDSCPPKLTESLRESGRRLIRESKSSPISLHSGGRFSSHHFILFNDIFVHSQYSSHQVYPLATVWVESPHKSNSLKNMIALTTPEDMITLVTPTASDKAEWLWTLIQTVDAALVDRRSLMTKSRVGRGFMSPPRDRNSYHVFTKHPVFKDAKYEGLWRDGKVHGQGKMQWPDGSRYVGHFQNGLQEGHGIYSIDKPEGREVCEGHWKGGKLHGLGCTQYACGDVYEGGFKEGKRHGHGYLKQGKLTTGLASMYIGEWVNDKKCGFGILSDILKGQRYIGLWQDDCRHGNGIIVTLDGMYFEGQFVQNKMTGFGLLMTEDNSSYEGEFAGSPHLYGKGSLTLPNGDYIEGHFNGSFSEGIKISGIFYKGTEPVTERKGFTHALGLIPKSYGCLSVPADRKWNELFLQCYCMLGCEQEGPTNTSRAWEKVAAIVTLRRKAAKKCGRQAVVSHDLPGVADDLARIPTFNGGLFSIEQVAKVREYLTKAFDARYHPLGTLMEGLVDVYRATYIGIGAHPRLLHHAVEEVRSYIERIYPLVIILFPVLPPAESEAVEICSESVADPSRSGQIDEPTEVFSPAGLLHPILLPKLYPPLFDLYALYNEKEDDVYWKRVLHWNRQPDVALMSYLGLAQDFWLVEESAYTNPRQRLSNVKECSYTGAIDMLQRLSTSFCPAEKLQQIHQTFHEINKAVHTQLKREHRWCMDDLFPVFMYIVVRARIQHLGAEIHFIDDLMEPHLEHGELGLMFTTLKACYFQIQHEKVT